MQTIPSLLRNRYLARFGTMLIAVALIAGTVGCPSDAVEYRLAISSTEGGSVTTPGEGISTYGEGEAVSLVAEPEEGYRFVEWTGDVATIADRNAASTTIIMNGDCLITASFVAVYDLTINSTGGGVVTAPGEGTFTYDEGTVVNLTAEAEEDYRFVVWTGDVGTITDPNAALTTIGINGDYSIVASFELEPTGAFLDEVVITQEPIATNAIEQLKDGTLDVCAYGMADALLHADVLADPDLTSVSSLGSFNDLTFNPVGPTFPETGKLNPFCDPQFREAMHWLIDRDYIVDEIMGGLAVPRFTCLHPAGVDATQRFPDVIAVLEAKYDHNPAKAATIISERMTALGAVKESGKWMYEGEPVEIIGLIRIEDERNAIGDYFTDLLEGQGFRVTRQYGASRDLLPLWTGDPNRGLFHFYTGGWWSTIVPRDDGNFFGAFYTNLWSAMSLWRAYENDPVFYEAAEKLWNFDYGSMEERATLFGVCLSKSMEDNVRMFLFSRTTFNPMQANVRIAHDAFGGVFGSWMWALTAHFTDAQGDPIVGGAMRIATVEVLTNPWNPVAGTNSVYDMLPIRATGDLGHWPDTRTGLRWPGRIERAEVTVVTGLPVSVTNTEWCNLTFSPEIQVPLDAWADWDAVNQEFLTVENRFGAEGATAKIKSVSYYPKEIFEIPLHDGSTLSVGDFILYTILQFDSAKPGSAIYDESAVAAYNNLMSHFKGVRFITDNPDYGLIVEYYSDQWRLDAELMVTTMFPYYSQSPGMWHTIALGIRAEGDGALAFSGHKSGTLGVPWMNFIDGPSLPILSSYLDSAKATNYIPYQPTMGLHVTEAEVAKRWSNLELWYADKGHFWVGSGPFYLESADTTQKVIHLKRFEDYPDPMDKWLFLLEPLP